MPSLAVGRSRPPLAEVRVLVVLLVDGRGEEIEKVGHDRLRALTLQKLDEVVVCKRHVLDKDLADHADARLSERFVDGEGVKVLHDAAAELGVAVLRVRARERVDADVAPLVVQRVRAALCQARTGRTRYRQRISTSPSTMPRAGVQQQRRAKCGSPRSSPCRWR